MIFFAIPTDKTPFREQPTKKSKRAPGGEFLGIIAIVKKILALAILVTLTVGAGCSSKEKGAPSAGELLAKSSLAARTASSAAIEINLKAKTSAPGESFFDFSKGVGIEAAGAIDKNGVILKGEMTVAGIDVPVQIRADKTSTVIKVGNTFAYGGDGKADLENRLAPYASIARVIFDNQEQIVGGEVSTVGNSWQLKGTINQKALLAASAKRAIKTAGVPAIASALRVTIICSKKTFLVSSIDVSYQGKGATELGGIFGQAGSSKTSTINLKIKLSDWGKKINLGPATKPTNPGFTLSMQEALFTASLLQQTTKEENPPTGVK